MANMGVWGQRALGWTAMWAALGATAYEVYGQQSELGVEELLGYHFDGGSRWRQDNEDFEPGGEEPAYWVRLMEWGPGRDVVLADAFAVYEDDRCEPISHMVFHWDPENGRVALSMFGAAGVLAEGYVERLGPTQNRIVVSVELPNGTQMRNRDTSDHSRPDQYTTQAERWADGEWVLGGTARWRRDLHESPCG